MKNTGKKVNTRAQQAEQSKAKILVATIEVLATHGIKGTTHRAIANHAEIQLSLITYYFKDIKVLIKEAFIQYSQQALVSVMAIWENVFSIADAIDKKELKKVAVKTQLCEQLSDIATEFLIRQVVDTPLSLGAEQVLMTQARFSPELKQISDEHREKLTAPLVKFCKLFNKKSPEIDAQIVLILFTQIEYQQLSNPDLTIDKQKLAAMVKRTLGNAMGLKYQ